MKGGKVGEKEVLVGVGVPIRMVGMGVGIGRRSARGIGKKMRSIR